MGTTDGENCLDWTSRDLSVYMSKCDPNKFEHQQWKFVDGHLTSGGAGGKVLDWTIQLNADGGRKVYMNDESSRFPHQVWHLNGYILTADGGDGLCLDWLPPNTVEMRACIGMNSLELLAKHILKNVSLKWSEIGHSGVVLV